jgi:nickel/cobalt exporter
MQSEKILRKKRTGVVLHYLILTLIAMMIGLYPAASFAHPMGNFSISHYAGITIEGDSIDVLYLIDMAEIPTFQEMQDGGLSGHTDDPKLQSYLTAKSHEFVSGLNVSIDSYKVSLQPISQSVIFPPGAGGLLTMRFGFLYRGKAACRLHRCRLSYQDVNFPGRAGWKEVVVKAGRDVVLMNSTAPDHDRSDQLTNYPTDLVNSPPQIVEASITLAPAALAPGSTSSTATRARVQPALRSLKQYESTRGAAQKSKVPQTPMVFATTGIDIKPNRQQTPRSAFTELIASQRVGIGIALLAALIAAGLGALHALEPGHGKTIVAAYLVGSKGTAWHALLLGLIVTVTHTAGVYLLGAVTLYAQKYILPEKLYPFLGVLSGILIAGMGFYLFLQRYVGDEAGHSHEAGGHTHTSLFRLPSGRAASEAPGSITNSAPAGSTRSAPVRQLLILGITGGIVPCPAALVVLLSAVALHRVVFGLFLILSFSSGLALVLIAMGMVAVYAGRLMSRVGTDGPLIQRWLPLVSALMITILGSAITVRGLMAAGIVQIHV